MDLLFSHKQSKIDKKYNTAVCCLELYCDDEYICFKSFFDSLYKKNGDNVKMRFDHELSINLKNGDINVVYIINNGGVTPDALLKSSSRNKKNDFKLLEDLIDNGLFRGEKKHNFWGIKYYRAIDSIVGLIGNILVPKLDEKRMLVYENREKNKTHFLYELIVDFHLKMKNIKGHDDVYSHIQYNYPKKKWLNKNENKFLPAILDEYGIKSKYLIKELNTEASNTIQLKSLRYLCSLFGESYIDYLKQIPWKSHCSCILSNNKLHELKNDSEKKSFIQLVNNWEKYRIHDDSIIYTINKCLELREFLEEKGYVLKFNAKNDYEYDNTHQNWLSIKIHLSKGYKNKYVFDENFINDVEQKIIINEFEYDVIVLKNEDDFRLEGYMMKNCISKQFIHGIVYIFVSLRLGRRRVNLQYRNGLLVQSYGKANTETPDDFLCAIEKLTEKMGKWKGITWKKEKYDFIVK